MQCTRYDYQFEDLTSSVFITLCPNTKKQIVIQEFFGKYISWEYEYQNSLMFGDLDKIYYCYNSDKDVLKEKLKLIVKQNLKNIGFVFCDLEYFTINELNEFFNNELNIPINSLKNWQLPKMYFQTVVGTQYPALLAELNILNGVIYNTELCSCFNTWNKQFKQIDLNKIGI